MVPDHTPELAQWQSLREGLLALAEAEAEMAVQFATLLGEGHTGIQAAHALQLNLGQAAGLADRILLLAAALDITPEPVA